MASGPRPTRLCVYTKTWRASGTGLFAQQLTGALADAGANVLFIAPAAENDEFEKRWRQGARWRPPRELDVSASRIARSIVSAGRVIAAAVLLLLARLRRRVFIVTIADPLVFMAPVFALLRVTGARIIWIVHDPAPHAWVTKGALRKVEKFGFQAVYALSDTLVTLSESGADVLRATFRLGRKRIVHIEHGLFPERAAPRAPNIGRFVLFGTLRANKGVAEAIEGVRRARAAGLSVSLLIAGAPHGPEQAYWRACRASASGEDKAIEIREGYVHDGDLDALIAECDAFLMPYREFQSQSGVAMLALGAGRPLVATRVGGLSALFDEGAPGVVIEAPADAAAVAGALGDFMAQDAEARARACLAFREHLAKTRSWSALAPAYLSEAARLSR